jgi:hypothetical protein
LVLAESAPAGLMNGDFSSDLSVGWDSYGVTRFNEKAIFYEDNYDDSNPSNLPPQIFYLEQLIDVEAGLQELSFDILINTGGGETDYFDVIVGESNINIWNTHVGPLPLTTITHHINSLGPQNLRFELRFDLVGGYRPSNHGAPVHIKCFEPMGRHQSIIG